MDRCFDGAQHVKLVELLAGYGSPAMALKRLGVHFTHKCISEWDVNACKSYRAIHFPNTAKDFSASLTKEGLVNKLYKMGISSDGKTRMTQRQIMRRPDKWLRSVYNDFKNTNNLGAISNVHAKDIFDDNSQTETIVTYSFPCQNLNTIDDNQGMYKKSGIRASALGEVERILNEAKDELILPYVLIMESVPAIHNKRNARQFKKWLYTLKQIGYTSYWQDMNAKDYGVPQNRVRTFVVSVLGDIPYTFPYPIQLIPRLRDVLETSIDERFYINKEKAHDLIKRLIDQDILPYHGTDYLNPKVIGQMDNSVDHTYEIANRVYDINGVSPTINACTGGEHEPKIIISPDQIYYSYTVEDMEKKQKIIKENLASRYRVRKLTPIESLRLMDVSEDCIYAMRKIHSNKVLYKQAGNSIVVNCLVAILGQLFEGKEKRYKQSFLSERWIEEDK